METQRHGLNLHAHTLATWFGSKTIVKRMCVIKMSQAIVILGFVTGYIRWILFCSSRKYCISKHKSLVLVCGNPLFYIYHCSFTMGWQYWILVLLGSWWILGSHFTDVVTIECNNLTMLKFERNKIPCYYYALISMQKTGNSDGLINLCNCFDP